MKLSSWLIIGLVLCVGCASFLGTAPKDNDFYGVKIPHECMANGLVLKSYSGEEVEYEFFIDINALRQQREYPEWITPTLYKIVGLKTETPRITIKEIAEELNISELAIEQELNSLDKPSLAIAFDSYKKNQEKIRSNPKIYAWGKINSSMGQIELSISNKTNTPISMNYVGDKFKLIAQNGNTYILEKPKTTSYPNRNYINPNGTVWFSLRIPNEVSSLKKEDVEMIVCVLGVASETTIVLLPLPDRN